MLAVFTTNMRRTRSMNTSVLLVAASFVLILGISECAGRALRAGIVPGYQPSMSSSSRLARMNRLLYKKSESPQWEDLGWAWGKRSDPTMVDGLHPIQIASRSEGGGGYAQLRPFQNKKAPDWQDLGWAWGR